MLECTILHDGGSTCEVDGFAKEPSKIV